jgi:hypothetical protein
MFSLHERQQKRICRVAFFAVAVLPLLLTCVWVAWHILPFRAARYARGIEHRFRVRAEVTQLRDPRPGTTQIASVELAAWETGVPLVSLEGVEFVAGQATHRLVVQHATIHPGEPAQLLEVLPQWLADCRTTTDLYLHELVLSPTARLAHVRIRWTPQTPASAAGGQLRAEASRDERPAGSTSPGMQLVWTTAAQPATAGDVLLDTADEPLPLAWLAEVVPGFHQSSGGVFRGKIRWREELGQWRGSLVGQIRHFQPQSWLPAGSPHRLDGVGDVTIDRMSWQGERLESLSGSLRLVEGRMNRSLWSAAIGRLFCRAAPGVAAEFPVGVDLQAYDLATCRFELDRRGLTISADPLPAALSAAPERLGEEPAGDPPAAGGAAADSTTGTIAWHEGRALLLQPGFVQLPVGSWVQFLAEPGSSWLPATARAVETASRLPLP